ncbi:MAG TPA: GAF domain-containing protein [Solirubrobacteraceae bacterium]|nr:GAF domain-containing protein [Solirubrobacteraceae bacterium]
MSPSEMREEVLSAAHASAIELFADVLAQGELSAAEDDFYSRLCEATVRATRLRRAIIFRYDSARRRVRAAGSFGIDVSIFADAFITVESAPLAKRALELDRVIEVTEGLERELPSEYVRLLHSSTVVCSPMSARGRWLGAIVAERDDDAPPLDDAERDVLWILGKTAALASMARVATRQREKARQLEHRIDLTREVHENVIQRLFGISLALSPDRPLDEATRLRCAQELQRSLAELRSALERPLGRSAPDTKTTLAEEVRRLRHEHPDLGIEPEPGAELVVPAALEGLAQSVLAEAVRNAHKHAQPTRVSVRAEMSEGTFVLEVSNDGVQGGGGRAQRAGVGLRLAAMEALQAGGVLEFGQREQRRWRVRLVVPLAGEGL